jgi:TctA family transporter
METKTSLKPAIKIQQQIHRNEQSLDYIIRSGFAGGVAGCLVSPS